MFPNYKQTCASVFFRLVLPVSCLCLFFVALVGVPTLRAPKSKCWSGPSAAVVSSRPTFFRPPRSNPSNTERVGTALRVCRANGVFAGSGGRRRCTFVSLTFF